MTAPRWTTALLRQLAPAGRSDDILGDLHEVHSRRMARRRPAVALTLTTLDALDMAATLLLWRFRRSFAFGRYASEHRRGKTQQLKGPDPGTNGDWNTTGRWQMRRSLEGWIRDFAHAARGLRRAPGFTAVTVATLALAIGANTAIFSVVDTVLLDPLDYPESDRLVMILASAPGSDLPEEFNPAPEFYVQYRENADLLEDLGMYRAGQTTVRSEDRIDRLFFAQVTPSMFTTLSVTPVLGRLPTEQDDPFRVMVISHWLWTTWFSADPEVIGRSYEVSGEMRTVIGVMDEDFRFLDDRIAVWIHAMLGDDSQIRPGNFGFGLIGRMTPGTEGPDLEAQLTVLASRLPERFGGSAAYARIIEQHRPIVRSLEESLIGDVAKPLWLLLGTVAIVFLIACANVANLFVVRGESRRCDLAVRQALGAGRTGLVRTLMAEALLLSAMGAAAGILLAWVGLPLLVQAAPENIPNLAASKLDSAAVIFTVGAAFLAACLFGLLPAIQFSRPHLANTLRQGGHGGNVSSHWGRNALVLVQTASALVLLVGSGLLIRSFWTLSHVDPGYDTQDIFSFQLAPAREELNDGPSFAQFHQMFLERLTALPGVQTVGLTNWLPLDEGAGTNRFTTDQTAVSGETPPPMRFTFVGGEYFQTMGISLVRGRSFEPSDQAVGPTSAMVSEMAAARLWPGEDPIGKRLAMSADTTSWLAVIGVVEDVFIENLRQAAPDPMIYLPMVGPTARSWAVGSPAYVVKTARADVIAADIRNLMREVVPESPMYRIFTMEALADRSMAQLTFTMIMLAMASVLALALGAVGLYGVLSYVVTNRAPEIAVRMALGAEAPRVRRMVVAQGARVTMAGVVVGLIAALASTRLLDTLLFGVGTLDLLTFVAMSVVMVAVAFLASYLPARRASSVDPMRSLRME